MTKIFNISLHRSGTSSFALFCGQNGLKWQHWPGEQFDADCRPALAGMDLDFVWTLYTPLLAEIDAFADLPMPFLFRQAHVAFPGAKFILLTRPVADWIKSVRQHCRNRNLDTLEQFQYRFICRRQIARLDELSDRELFFGYEGFVETATNYFTSMRADFLIASVQEADVSARLNRFFGFSKGVELPKVNAAS